MISQLRTLSFKLWICVGFLLLGGLICYLNYSSEPTYQGRPLTKWLEDAWTHRRPNPNTSAAQDKAKFETARTAIVSIGTNGIPTLLSLLTYKDSPLKIKMLNLLNSQTFIHPDILRDSDRKFLAMIGFAFLGTNSQPAFADLVHISQSSDVDQKATATDILKYLSLDHKPPLPLLINTLQDSRPDVREEITNMIIKFYPEEASKLQLNKTDSH
jgi:HEAT repeat protein